MDKIKTATGKEFDCDFFNPLPEMNRLYLRVLNSSVPVVASVFSDPRETVQLWFGEQYESYYTKLQSIGPEGNAIRVVLGKG